MRFLYLSNNAYLQPISEDVFKITNTVVETCSCSNLTLRLLILLVYKSLLLLFGAFLARQTRRIYIPALGDARRCGVCVFVALVASVAGVVVSFITALYPSLFHIVIGGCMVVVTTFILVVMYNYQVSDYVDRSVLLGNIPCIKLTRN